MTWSEGWSITAPLLATLIVSGVVAHGLRTGRYSGVATKPSRYDDPITYWGVTVVLLVIGAAFAFLFTAMAYPRVADLLARS
ncbi:hypothetical protein [Caulobacter sp. 17J65-9]|uniref:hypothetical protein n=1 Tax=Caulobacter sp. 17J65-9 TaxID=2709382 RepID=UPI0013C831A1|nr:hypothetical protein [Caulobacter sp. 17J65-9]NEX94891.1 hypothetical protein [Caulobacter sp. 17J65-9]